MAESARIAMTSFYRQYGDVHIVCAVHTQDDPSDEEWAQYIGLVQHMRGRSGEDFHRTGGLAITDGGGPRAAQRKILLEAIGDAEPLGAVVTDSSVVDGIITALAWFRIRVKGFRPHAFPEALRYLGIPESDHATCLHDILVHAEQLDSPVSAVQRLSLT